MNSIAFSQRKESTNEYQSYSSSTDTNDSASSSDEFSYHEYSCKQEANPKSNSRFYVEEKPSTDEKECENYVYDSGFYEYIYDKYGGFYEFMNNDDDSFIYS